MAGTQTSAIFFGGPNGPPYTGATEQWNGSSWTEVNDLSTGRGYAAGSGSTVGALCMAGHDDSAKSSAVEEWDAGGATSTLTVS
jgi:hypothetical protein